MNTTSLFVELVIIGVGGACWLALAVLSVFGYDWVPTGKIDALPAILAVLAPVYVLGIVIDRLGGFLFQGWDRRLRQKHFPKAGDYQRARTVVFDQSQSLREWFQYSRSRLRICRGWTVNALLCLLTANLFIWSALPLDAPRLALSLWGTIGFGLLALGVGSAWRRLAEGEYKRLWDEYGFAREREARRAGGPA
jgi:hypothetical protein